MFTRLPYKRVHESPQKLVRRSSPCNRTCPQSFNPIEQSNPLCPTLGAWLGTMRHCSALLEILLFLVGAV